MGGVTGGVVVGAGVVVVGCVTGAGTGAVGGGTSLSFVVVANGLTAVFPANVSLNAFVAPRNAFGSEPRSDARHRAPLTPSAPDSVRRVRAVSFVVPRTVPVQAFRALVRAGTANDTVIVVVSRAPDTDAVVTAAAGVTARGAFAAAGTAGNANARRTQRPSARTSRPYQRSARHLRRSPRVGEDRAMRSRHLSVAVVAAIALAAVAAPGAGAKAAACKPPKVKIGKFCVNFQTRAANGSYVTLGTQYGKGKPVRVVVASVRQALTATCSDGTSAPLPSLTAIAIPITRPSFSGTARRTNSAGDTVSVLRGRYTSNTRVVIDELSQTYPKGGGVTCSVAVRNVVIQQGR